MIYSIDLYSTKLIVKPRLFGLSMAILLVFLGLATSLSQSLLQEGLAQEAVEGVELPLIAPGALNEDADLQNTNNRETGQGVKLKRVVVEGALRIDPASVNTHFGLVPGDLINDKIINEALKRLFATGLFSDVTIEQRGQLVIIRVQENPIINRIAFEGNDEIKNEILETEVQLRSRIVYTRTKVQSDVQRLLDIYRRSGYFAVKIMPKIIKLEQNRIDLVFEIEEGGKTGIKDVLFVGNRFFSDDALQEVINTKISRWYNFLSSGDNYDPDKLNFDKELLRRYYLANGFADFRVVSAVAELDDAQENFYITFTIEEGERYKFGDFDLVNKIEDLDSESLRPLITLENGDWYDADAVNKIVQEISDNAGNQGYAFVNVRPKVRRNAQTRIIDINFEILEAPKVFVDRIDIKGNVRTLDKVIRRELTMVEGDAFNKYKLGESKRNISNLGFFQNVNVTNAPGSDPDKTRIDVEVEEQSTGELSVGGGYSSNDGALASLRVTERNLMGRGQRVSLDLSLAQYRQDVNFSFTEPYFMDKEIAAGFDLFHTVDDNQDESSYDQSESGFGLRTGYQLNDDWRHNFHYRFSIEDIENIPDDASIFVQDDEGEKTLSSIGTSFTFDRRNSRIDPTEGGYISNSTDFTGLGGDMLLLQNRINAAYYIPLSENIVLKNSATLGIMVNLDDDEDLRVADRFFIGGDSLRGFAPGGIGPRDTDTKDALGGMQYATASLELFFPLGLPEEYGVRGSLFADAGTLRELEDEGDNVYDDDLIRSAIGAGLHWRSPFGPIRFEYGYALTEGEHDNTETFRINFGTRF